MTTEQIIGFAVSLMVMGVGLAGCILPFVPSTPLILVAALVHRFIFGPNGPSTRVLVVMLALTLLSFALQHLASVIGARQFGARKRGMLGAIVGGVVGVFFGLPGVLVGPFVGAALFEMAGKRPWREAGRAGIGAVLGLLAGVVGEFACCAAMIGLFILSVLMRTLG